MKNRIKQFRTKLGLSQKQLAERVGTSQQQIQRLETGKVAARIDVAHSLGKALNESLNVIFPGSAKALDTFAKEHKGGYLPAVETYSSLAKTGVEGDPRIWFLKILLRGHSEPMIYEISAQEKRRLFSAVQGEGEDGGDMSFIVFDTTSRRIAMNLKDLLYCHFLFEPFNIVRDSANEEPSSVQVFFSGNERVVSFTTAPDDGSPDDEDDEGRFRTMFFMLESSTEENFRFCFTDGDGEDVFLRAGDIALLDVALWVVDPDELHPDEDDEEESESPDSLQ